MKLYHVSRKDDCDYDEYSDFVVAAEDEETAKRTLPDGSAFVEEKDRGEEYWYDGGWVSSLTNVEVEYLGEAREGMIKHVICTSFHAG